MLKKLINHFMRRVIKNKDGLFGIDDAILWPALISAGSGILGGALGGEDEQEPQFKKAEEYPEAKSARETWWDKLNQWGSQPDYGAISPDWEDIWSQAQRKVRNYFWGTATQPGLSDKVKASAARRGVSDSPALQTELTKMGQEEGSMLSDIAKEQAIQKANFSETGRQNWLSSLTNLSGLNPNGQWYTPQQTTGNMGTMIGSIGNALSSAMQQQQQQDWIKQLLSNSGTNWNQNFLDSYFRTV